MHSIGIRELKQQTSKILQRVREQGEMVEVTYHGKAVARIVPIISSSKVTSPPLAESQHSALWADMDELAAKIGKKWPPLLSAIDALEEGRRTL